MAENKRTYTITISGLTESYENVKSLREALDSLSDTVINVSNEEQKTSETRKSTASSTDALAKAQEKLNNYDKQYQEELAKVNASLSANKKEISDALKLQQAQDVVDAKQLDTYAQKQQYLSALNTLIRNHTTATDEDVQAIDAMVQESAALQAELKNIDAEMKIYVRNVGNYNEAADKVVESHKSVKSELKDLKAQMADMLANGVSKTDEAYLQLAERAGYLKDAMKDANEDITNFASDTRGMTNAINLAQSAVGAYQLYNSTMELFGQGNEEAAESMKKMMAVMTVLNSLQQVQNSLLENGSATARLYHKAVELVQAALGIKKAAVEENIAVTEASTVAEEANTVASELNATASEANATSTGTATAAETANTGAVTTNTTATEANTVATTKMSLAQKAGAVASNILSVALRAIPLMAVIGLVMALIQNWESIWNWFKKTFPVLDTLSKKIKNFGGFLNALITAVKATAYAIKDFLITAVTSLGESLSLLFSGHWSEAVDKLKNIFKDSAKAGLDAANNELTKGFQKGEQERTAIAAEESNKRTKQELEELKIRERNNKTYSKKHIELQQKEFDERKAMAKGNQEELNKIKLEEMQFYADVEDKKTAYANEQNKKREANAKKSAKAAADAQKKIEKEAEEERKALEEQKKNNQKTIESSRKADLDKWKSDIKAADDEEKKLIEGSSKVLIQKYSEVSVHRTKLANLTAEKEAKEQEKIRKEEELTIKKSEALAKTASGNIEDISGKARAEIAGLETDILDIEGELTELDGKIVDEQIVFNNAATTFEAYLSRVDNATSRRILNTVQLVAQKAKEEKENVLTEIKELEDRILETTKQLAKKDDKELQDQKKELETQLASAKRRLDTLFGEYANKEIKVPVTIDVDGIIKNYNGLKNKLKADNQEMSFSMSALMQYLVGMDEVFSGLVTNEFFKSKEPSERIKNLNRLFGQFAQVLGLSDEKTVELFEDIKEIAKHDVISVEDIQRLESYFDTGEVKISKLGTIAKDSRENITSLVNYTGEQMKKAYDNLISEQNKVISSNEKIVKGYRDATKDYKIEPVINYYKGLFAEFDREVGITKLNIEETRKRYAKLKAAYKAYLETVTEGSEQMKAVEDAWQTKLEGTKAIYGEDSMEYKQMFLEKENAMQAYVIEREKAQQKLDEIERGENELDWDGVKNNLENLGKILQVFQNEVMSPIFDGLSDFFSLQVEEAQEALDEITELYDKAVEAREQSADRLKEINEELRNDDGQNKEALQQRLAEEEVLLVQREEAERALEKEKAKREYEVEVAEFNQRKFELSQKLIEGVVNTALGITAALKYGPILGPIFAAIIGAMGALQTGIISKQIGNLKKPTKKFGEGGKVGEQGISRSHKQGGHRIEGTNIEVEGQEWVINKKSSQKYDSLLRAINDDNIGLVRKQVEIIRERRIINNTNQIAKFATGGQINTLTATSAIRENNEIAAITELIKAIDFQPTVAVTDINRVNRRLVRVQDLAGKAV